MRGELVAAAGHAAGHHPGSDRRRWPPLRCLIRRGVKGFWSLLFVIWGPNKSSCLTSALHLRYTLIQGGETVKTYRGRPILSARMPQAYIDGLHKLADRRGCTMADILRELVRDELRSEHIPTTLKPAQGQTRMSE